MRSGKKSAAVPFALVSALLLVLICVAVNTGSVKIGFLEMLRGLFVSYNESAWAVFDMRFPRILVSLLAGAALAVSGVLFQAVMKNPLADPGIMGISAGAKFASAVILACAPSMFFLAPVFAFAGGAAACALVYMLSWKNGLSPLRVILVGVAVNALFMGLSDVFVAMSTGNVAVIQLGMKTWSDVHHMLWYVLVGLAMALILYRRCNLLALEDETLQGLGVNVNRLRVVISVAAVMLAAVVSAYVGAISFVGLIVPHIGRLLVGSDHKKLVPFSLLSGAFTILLADTVGRTIIAPMEIPASVVMAVMGAPFFILLLRRSQQLGGQRGRKGWRGRSLVKIIHICVGCIALALGGLGVLLPFLPTTPFLLLASYCFARSSERLNGWLKNTKLYRDNLESLVEKRGMPKRAKLRVMAAVTAVMTLAFLAMHGAPHGRICIFIVWLAHIIALAFVVKTAPNAKEQENAEKGKEGGERDYDDR